MVDQWPRDYANGMGRPTSAEHDTDIGTLTCAESVASLFPAALPLVSADAALEAVLFLSGPVEEAQAG